MWNWEGRLQPLLLALTGAALALGAASWSAGAPVARDAVWMAGTAFMLLATGIEALHRLRRGEAGIDVLALLTMAGALALGQYLAGAVIAFMLASGRALEGYAGRRARRELSGLLARQPRTALRYEQGELRECPAEAVRPGDRLLVRPGETVPVDGLLLSGAAVLDEAALTGEPMPAHHSAGATLASGTINAGHAFEMRARARASQSTYAGVIRLVHEAEQGKAPFTRLADRYALWFVPLALAVAGAAWLASGDPIRALAVLVVATPCPLILAAPVAIVSGISQAARRGVLVKNGGALEALARVRTVVFDKTGTLTVGLARLEGVETAGDLDPDEALRLAASLDQASQHVSAQTLVAEARRRGLTLTEPEEVEETPGAGLAGRVGAHRVRVGSPEWLGAGRPASDWMRGALRRMTLLGCSGAFLEVDGHLAAALLLADEVRLDTPRALRALRRAGIGHTIMLSGDRQDVAETIAAALDIDTVLAERTPAEKIAAVEDERARAPVAMVGDGINDAPALAAADVGIAMGARGASAAAQAADVVLLVDRLDRLAEGIVLARRSRDIALQSVFAGMGLSLAAMALAAFGLIAPALGAALQEAIDVAVILNALRALAPAGARARPRALAPELREHLRRDHDLLSPLIDRIAAAAHIVATAGPERVRPEVVAVAGLLRNRLLPHEREDERTLYPQLADALRGNDPLASMSRTHREIFHLARLYERIVEDLPPGPIAEFELGELRRLLYGLAAILRLHFAQEEELFHALDDG